MQSFLSIILSAMLVFTSVNCLCAPIPVSQQNADMHAMHQGHGMVAERSQESADCSHDACPNDCGDINALPTLPEIQQIVTRLDVDDDDDIYDAVSSRHPEITFDATGPPRPLALLAASTPVNRYDTLLE